MSHQQTCCLNTFIFKSLNQHCLTYGPTKQHSRHLVGHQALVGSAAHYSVKEKV